MVRSSPPRVPTGAVPVVGAADLAGLRQVPPHVMAHASPEHDPVFYDARSCRC